MTTATPKDMDNRAILEELNWVAAYPEDETDPRRRDLRLELKRRCKALERRCGSPDGHRWREMSR